MKTFEQQNFILVLLCAQPPNQKFWNGSDWSENIDDAITYERYGDALNKMYDEIPKDKVTARIHAIPKEEYIAILKNDYD